MCDVGAQHQIQLNLIVWKMSHVDEGACAQFYCVFMLKISFTGLVKAIYYLPDPCAFNQTLRIS